MTKGSLRYERGETAMLNAISTFVVCEERTHAEHDHTLTTTSFSATRELLKSAVAQESVSAPSKAIHNRPVVVGSTRRK